MAASFCEVCRPQKINDPRSNLIICDFIQSMGRGGVQKAAEGIITLMEDLDA